MSVFTGPGIVTRGLIAAIDNASRKTTLEQVQSTLINTSTWTVGTGGATGYAANGAASESQRLNDTDPWGNTTLVWQTNPDGGNDASGGWEGSYFNIDPTKLYRSSVWVRRISSTANGSFYHGLHTNGSGDVYNLGDGASNGNPYWHYTGVSALTQNQWYLSVGHIYPWSHAGTTRHPESGLYIKSNGATIYSSHGGNITDCKFPSNATQAYQRVYHYYAADTTTKLQFADPRWDLVNGNEPTIAELLNTSPKRMNDATGNGYHAVLSVPHKWSNNSFQLDGSNTASITNLDLSTSNYTVIGAARYTGSTRGRIINGNSNNWLMGHWSSSTENYYAMGWVTGSGTGANDTNWRIYAATGNYASDLWSMYVNGNATVTNGNGGANGPNGFAFPAGSYGSEQTVGEFQFMLVYNTVLTSDEVKQTFNALKGRFSL